MNIGSKPLVGILKTPSSAITMRQQQNKPPTTTPHTLSKIPFGFTTPKTATSHHASKQQLTTSGNGNGNTLPSKLPVSVTASLKTPATSTAAVGGSSLIKMPKTTPSTAQKQTPLSGIVKQRLQFFCNNNTNNKTPASNRLAAVKEDSKNIAPSSVSKGTTPASRKLTVFGGVGSSSAAKQPTMKATMMKTNLNTRIMQQGSKTPAAPRPLPSGLEKKVSHTVGCAQQIKRRSIRILNNVIILFKYNVTNCRLDSFQPCKKSLNKNIHLIKCTTL